MVDSRQPIRSFKDLDVWKMSLSLAQTVYQLTAAYPAGERFGLVLQMRRGAVSIMSNIAEGHARGTSPEYVHFLHIAQGAAAELEAQLILAESLGYGDPETRKDADRKMGDVRRLLSGLLRRLQTPRSAPGLEDGGGPPCSADP